MSTEIAFVGDVHGNLSALRGLCDVIPTHGARHVIFLGDYINKGRESAEVMQELVAYSRSGFATLLRGNHEAALLDVLDTGDLAPFLKMGGAVTIRSYAGPKVGPDVLREFRAKFPSQHLDAIRSMPQTYESDDLIAQHMPPKVPMRKFCISSHLPIGDKPRIGRYSAQLDTGCGAGPGRLTALLWPTLDYIQVDAGGAVVPR